MNLLKSQLFNSNEEPKDCIVSSMNLIELRINQEKSTEYIYKIAECIQIKYYQLSLVSANKYTIESFETTSLGHNELSLQLIKPIFKITKMKKPKGLVSRLLKIFEEMEERGSLPLNNFTDEVDFVDETNLSERDINDLPKHIILSIFKFIDNKSRKLILPRVCRYWYDISRHPSLWPELTFEGQKVSTYDICKILHFCTNLAKIRLIALPGITHVLRVLSRNCETLKEIYIQNCNLTSNVNTFIVQNILKSCSLLETLDLTGTYFNSERIIRRLVFLTGLKNLNISGCATVTVQDLLYLSVNCQQLQDFKYSPRVNRNGAPQRLLDQSATIFLKNLETRLTVLDLDMHDLGSHTFHAILKCKLLKELGMSNAIFLNGELLLKLTTLSFLQKLKLTKTYNINSEDFIHFFQGQHYFKELDFTECWTMRDETVEAILIYQPQLEKLTLSSCNLVTSGILYNVINAEKLKWLNISYLNFNLEMLKSMSKENLNLKMIVLDLEQYRRETLTIEKLKIVHPNLEICSNY